jgi:hypothetical protein
MPIDNARVALRGLLAASALAGLAALAHAETIYALHDGNELVRFDSATPATTTAIPVTGLTAGETLVGIDFRPADGTLYGMTDAGRVYSIVTSTGAATLFTTSSVALAGTSFGVDFSPANDRFRVVSDADQDFKIEMATGVATADLALAYEALDENNGANPVVTAIAFTNNAPGVTSAQIYVIDTGADVLATLIPATGALTTRGHLGVDANGSAGLDISRRGNTAYASLDVAASTGLYRIDIVTGVAALVGPIGSGANVRGLAVEPPPPPAAAEVFGVTTANELVRFASVNPAALTPIGPVTGLQEGEVIVGIDFRPADLELYAVGSTSRLYTIDTETGAATLVAELSTGLSGEKFGIDFDPVADRLRIVSEVAENLRVDPANGNVTADANLAYAPADAYAGQSPYVVALGNSNDLAGAARTTLYAIDATYDSLAIMDPPNNGTLTTVGALGFDAGIDSALDIVRSSNLAFAALTYLPSATNFFSVDLATGQATLIGPVGSAVGLRAMAVVPTAALDVGHAVLKFNFKKPDKDKFMVSGSLPALDGPSVGVVVTVDIGGVAQTFTLDDKGRAREGDDTFALIGKPKNGRVKFLCQFKKGDFSDETADEGMDGTEDAKKETRTIAVRMGFGDLIYEASLDVKYTAKAGKSGIAKFAR